MDNVSMGGGLKAVVYCSHTGHAKKMCWNCSQIVWECRVMTLRI